LGRPLWYIKELNTTDAAVVLGEFGGPYEGANAKWYDALISYLTEKDMQSSFFWDLNPDSSTTGLLLDDWETPNLSLLVLLDEFIPNPTIFEPFDVIPMDPEFLRIWKENHVVQPKSLKEKLQVISQEKRYIESKN